MVVVIMLVMGQCVSVCEDGEEVTMATMVIMVVESLYLHTNVGTNVGTFFKINTDKPYLAQVPPVM